MLGLPALLMLDYIQTSPPHARVHYKYTATHSNIHMCFPKLASRDICNNSVTIRDQSSLTKF